MRLLDARAGMAAGGEHLCLDGCTCNLRLHASVFADSDELVRGRAGAIE